MKTSLALNDQELKQVISDLEKTLLAKALEWAREVYKVILERLDCLIKRYRAKTLAIEHKRSTWYRTCLGPVRITRRQYRDGDGGHRYLLDELLGMEKYRHTTVNVQEIALELAGTVTFRRSADILRKTTAIDLSHQTIHRFLQRVADDCLKSADRATRWFLETGEIPQTEGGKAACLMVEADGVMLSLQREKASKTEVKLGIAYEGWEKVGKDRYRTVNKTFHADIASSSKFWADMTLKLHSKYDLSSIREFIVGGDGSTWVKEGVEYFGGRYQLCRYHLNRELCYSLGHDRETISLVQQLCNEGEVSTALNLLEEVSSKARGDKAKGIKRIGRYISSNASGLEDYRRHMEAGGQQLRRTGAIEGNVDKLVVRRMKNQGMSWTLQGIRRMLWLRLRLREGKLASCLYSQSNKTIPAKLPAKRINHVMDHTMKHSYIRYFNAGLPALYGPHASRPWVKMLKSLTEAAL